MPIDKKYLALFEEGEFYHVYNRCHSHKKMFFEEKNYGLFLNLIKKYLSPYIDVYAYCLFIKVKAPLSIDAHHNVHEVVSNAFRKLFIAYTNSVNKEYNLHGGLFTTPFRRICIDNNTYLTQLILYIHNNPLHHQITAQIAAYPFSSYSICVSNKPTLLKRNEVLQWFGGKESFIKHHQMHTESYKNLPFYFE